MTERAPFGVPRIRGPRLPQPAVWRGLAANPSAASGAFRSPLGPEEAPMTTRSQELDDRLRGWALFAAWVGFIVGSWALAVGFGVAVGYLWRLA